MMNSASGSAESSLMPPSERCSFCISRVRPSASFFDMRSKVPSCAICSISFSRLMDCFTNFKTVKQSIKRLKEMEQMAQDGTFERMSKKEALGLTREMQKLQRSLGGIKELSALPDALFIIDVGYQKGAVAEANKLGVPVLGVVDTNHTPEGIDYIIPGNDDSSRAIRLYARGMADGVLEGRTQSLEEVVAASRDEFVEVDEDEGAK